jgi:hypothetical protein
MLLSSVEYVAAPTGSLSVDSGLGRQKNMNQLSSLNWAAW